MKIAENKGESWRPPYGRSKLINGMDWTSKPLYYPGSHGDTWSATWADDDSVYVVGDDTFGINNSCTSNLAIFRVDGNPPDHSISMINSMTEYGENSGVENMDTWKGAGLVSVDGILYLGVGQHAGGADYPDNIQQAYDGSIVKSHDHGKTWSAKPKVGKAMWPGPRYATPFFVQYGRDYQDAVDDYVYSVSNGNTWNNGNYMILGRILRKKLPALNPDDWKFFAGADEQNNATWMPTRLVAHAYKAKSIFQHRGFTSMTGIQYVPGIKRFILAQWAYMDLDLPTFGPKAWPFRTMLCMYEAPKPWGPWSCFHLEKDWGGVGAGEYGPSIPSKWFKNGGQSMWMISAGCWQVKKYYRFTVRKMRLRMLRLQKPSEGSG